MAVRRGREGQERVITQDIEETLGGDECGYYLDCGDGFMGVYLCQKVSH